MFDCCQLSLMMSMRLELVGRALAYHHCRRRRHQSMRMAVAAVICELHFRTNSKCRVCCASFDKKVVRLYLATTKHHHCRLLPEHMQSRENWTTALRTPSFPIASTSELPACVDSDCCPAIDHNTRTEFLEASRLDYLQHWKTVSKHLDRDIVHTQSWQTSN